MTIKKTLIKEIIKQEDGAYLLELLLKKGYFIHDINRKSSLFNIRIQYYKENGLVNIGTGKDLTFKSYIKNYFSGRNYSEYIQTGWHSKKITGCIQITFFRLES